MSYFKVGDVVVLKSGSPSMTVCGAGSDEKGRVTVMVVWFSDRNSQFESEDFYSEVLTANESQS